MKFGQPRPRSDGLGQALTVKVHVTVHHTKGVHTRSYMVINKRFEVMKNMKNLKISNQVSLVRLLN